jgi:hypothetical protein
MLAGHARVVGEFAVEHLELEWEMRLRAVRRNAHVDGSAEDAFEGRLAAGVVAILRLVAQARRSEATARRRSAPY